MQFGPLRLILMGACRLPPWIDGNRRDKVHTLVDAFPESDVADSEQRRPVFQDKSFSVMRIPATCFSVFGLLARRSPSAVGRLILLSAFFAMAASVTAEAVDSVKRMGDRRSGAHVREEITKRLSPKGADINAACPVLWKALVVFLIAPHQHVIPNPILAESQPAIIVFLDAAATFRMAFFQIAALHDSGCAALATDLPFSVVMDFFAVDSFEYGESAKRLPDKINKMSHETSFFHKDVLRGTPLHQQGLPLFY